MSPLVLVLLLVGLIVAVIGIFKPFIGMLVLVLIHFVQPGEMIPVLNVIRLELVYGLIVFGIFVFRAASRHGTSLLKDPIISSLVKFMLIVVLTIPGSFWVGGSINSWLTLFKIALFVFLIKGTVESARQLKGLLWLQVLIFGWFAISGLWAFKAGISYDLHYNLGSLDRAEGINSMAGGPNELAGLLVALFPFVIGLWQASKNIFVRLLVILLGAVGMAMIVLAGSRIAAISMLMIGLFYVIASKRRLIAALVVASVALITWNVMPNAYQERYTTVATYADGGQLDASNELRLKIWKAGWRMFLDYPILGVGLGQFSTAYGTKYSGVEHGAWMQPHNLLIEVGCETGLVGLLFYSIFLLRIFKTNWYLYRRKGIGTEIIHPVAIASGAALIGIVALSWVSHTMLRPYWYFVGGIVAANATVATKLELPENEESTGDKQLTSDEEADYSVGDVNDRVGVWSSPSFYLGSQDV